MYSNGVNTSQMRYFQSYIFRWPWWTFIVVANPLPEICHHINELNKHLTIRSASSCMSCIIFHDVPFKIQPSLLHMKPFTHKVTKAVEMLNSCSWYISLSLYVHKLFRSSISNYHRQTLLVPRNFVVSRCTVVLFGTSMSRYALLNVSRTAWNDA